MEGLKKIPSLIEFLKVYELLQTRSNKISIQDLALWTQWARFDPRLAEQWMVYVGKVWKDISPIHFNEEIRNHPWPSAAGPLFEQVAAFLIQDRIERKLFKNWVRCVMSGICPALEEQYFIGLRAFGGSLMVLDASQSLKPYRSWGYYSREILINKALEKEGRTLLPAISRKKMLDQLIKSQKTIRSHDYISYLGGSIGRRQAELDLKNHPHLKAFGNTQGRFYRFVK